MQNANLKHWLAAIHSPSIGPRKILLWLSHFKSIQNLFTATTVELKEAGLKPAELLAIQNPNMAAIEKIIKWREADGNIIICFDDPGYPVLLKELSDPPLVLFVRGNPEFLSRPQIAMVGTRNPTVTGKQIAETFAFALAQAGLIVTSGMADGIDGASHRGALSAGAPTIAVLGTGVDCVYPAVHKKLAAEIAVKGALVSEFYPGTGASAQNFPRRNRIISGLSLGVVVIEAALRSGSLITARLANEQGREVFAVPGSIHNPLARGCHQIIREGAKLIETASHIIEELGALKQVLEGPKISQDAPEIDHMHQELISQVGYETTALETIILRSGLTASQVSSMLFTLEMQGYVNLVIGGYTRSAPK
jgi:DNA processing protein